MSATKNAVISSFGNMSSLPLLPSSSFWSFCPAHFFGKMFRPAPLGFAFRSYLRKSPSVYAEHQLSYTVGRFASRRPLPQIFFFPAIPCISTFHLVKFRLHLGFT